MAEPVRNAAHSQRPGLRAVLLALVLAGVLPLLGLTLYNSFEDRTDARNRVEHDARQLARFAALRHDDLVSAGHEVLAAIAQLPSVQDRDGTACSADLGRLLSLYPRFATLGVADAAGNLRCNAIPVDRPFNFADRAWFQRVRETGKFAVGDYQIGRISGRPTLVFGVPLFDGAERLSGVAFAALDLVWLQQFASQAEVGDDGVLVVIDQAGRILAQHPPSPQGQRIPDGIREGLDVKGGAVEAEGPDGVNRFYAFAPLGEDGTATSMVGVGIATSMAYAQANEDLIRNLGLVALIAFVGAGAAWLVAERLIHRPAQALVAAAGRVAAGDLASRAGPPYGSGQFGDVAQAFDRMAEALAARGVDLGRTREQLQAVIDNAPASIHVKNLDGRYLLVNQRFEQTNGVLREEVLGETAHRVYPAETAEAIEAHERAVIEARSAMEFKEMVPTAAGFRTHRALLFPLCDPSGTPYAVCGIVTDITDQLRAHAEREALQMQLAQSQRLESLGQLAGGIAHDFNNLLAVILNYADFAIEALPDEPPEELRPTLEGIRDDMMMIAKAGEKAAALTRQLLIFARRDPVHATVLDVNAVVEELVPLLRRTLGEDVRVELSLDAGLWPIRVDRSRLEQILVNLAVNSRDAMEAGGTLTVATENLTLDAAAARDHGVSPGRCVRVTVTDTGTGMPSDVADRAFDPFFTTKPKGQGTGLGLATVFGIVADAGGTVALTSTPGAGTSVRVILPGCPDVPVDADPDRASGPPTGHGETILIVEDEDPVRDVAERILSTAGYSVLTAGDAGEALRLCSEHGADIELLLTDVVMPGLSGPELVARARTLWPSLRVLYMSGYPQEFLARRHSVDEERDIVGKPFTAETLLHGVRRILDNGS